MASLLDPEEQELERYIEDWRKLARYVRSLGYGE
jgi:hypothetical protein